MRRQIIMCALLAAAAIGVNGVWAGGAYDGGQRTVWDEGWRPEVMIMPSPPPPEEIIESMARQLKLTDDQRAKIRVVLAADREKITMLVRKMGEYRKQLRDISHAAAFDEAAIRDVATKLSQAEVEVIVAGERARSKVSALLTPEQRVAAEKILPPFHRGQGPGGRCGCGHRPGFMPPPPPCGCRRGPGDGRDGDRDQEDYDHGCGEERE